MSTESAEQGHGGLGRQGRGGGVQESAGTESCHGHGHGRGHGHEHGTQHTQHTHQCTSLSSPGAGTGSWDGHKDQDGCRSTRGQGERQGRYQGLVGREHGGISAVPVQGHQRHCPEFLLGEVGGGAAAQDHGAQVVVLCTGTGWGSCPASLAQPCPAGWHDQPAPT